MLIMQDLCQVLKLDEDVHEKELIKEVLLDVFRMVKNFGIYQDNKPFITIMGNVKEDELPTYDEMCKTLLKGLDDKKEFEK